MNDMVVHFNINSVSTCCHIFGIIFENAHSLLSQPHRFGYPQLESLFGYVSPLEVLLRNSHPRRNDGLQHDPTPSSGARVNFLNHLKREKLQD